MHLLTSHNLLSFPFCRWPVGAFRLFRLFCVCSFVCSLTLSNYYVNDACYYTMFVAMRYRTVLCCCLTLSVLLLVVLPALQSFAYIGVCCGPQQHLIEHLASYPSSIPLLLPLFVFRTIDSVLLDSQCSRV